MYILYYIYDIYLYIYTIYILYNMLILTPLMTWIPHSQLLKFIAARGLQHGGMPRIS